MSGARLDPRMLDGPVLIVVNPGASRLRDPRRRMRIVADVEAWSRDANGQAPITVHVEDAASIGDAGTRAIHEAARLVVAVGGDGTVAGLTATLAGSGISLAIVPAGTGNVLATALGVPDHPARSVRALGAATRRSIDLGAAVLPGLGGEPTVETLFAVAAGVGWDARVMAATAGPHKHRLGRLAYWVAALGLLGEMAPQPYAIEVDDERLELEATVALVANAGELVPGLVRPRLPIVPDDFRLLDAEGAGDDVGGELAHLLVLLVLRVRNLAGGARGALELLGRTELGGSPSGAAYRTRGRRIRIAAEPAQPRQVDGDEYGAGAIEATVRPGALTVLVPQVDP